MHDDASSAGDFTKGITVAVMQGHDTDCNGAAVGSVLGVHLRARNPNLTPSTVLFLSS